MNKICFFTLFAFLIGLNAGPAFAEAASRAPASYTPAQLEKLWRPVGHKQRKQVTSNAFHFWAWSRNEAEGYLGAYLKPQGVIIGDPHPRNVFDYRTGRGSAKLAVADIDDGGRGPLFLDFARFVTYLEASDIDLKVGKIFDAYLSGLKQEEAPGSALLSEAEEKSAKDIEASHLRYVGKNTFEGKFLYAQLRMAPRADLSLRHQREIEKLEPLLLKQTGLSKVWDIGFRVNDSGSSAGMARYWFLLGNAGAPTRILEAKELAPRAAVDYYAPQAEDSARVAEVLKAYSDKGFDDSLFGVVKAGSNYWVRPRKYQALKVDDEDLKDSELREFALGVAHWMGAMQARQAGGAKLLGQIEEDPKAAKKAMEELVRAYLKEIKRLPE
ncbi:MAG: DUF2252 domain-containing protein [Proteobacteria bacterium]|nr:MAG: DUF2252 domain-containing protein [Pseudomonadota bacterium]